MPEYKFQNPKTLEIKEIFQKMKDPHIYSENGVEWNRVYDVPPNASIDTKINPFSEQEFKEKMGKKKNGNVGQLWDKSLELSKQRERLAGKDEVKEKTIKKYHDKTDKSHPLAKEIPKDFVITSNPKRK